MNSPARQAAGAVFMVRPAAFGFNAQTAPSNGRQQPAQVDTATLQQLACAEAEGLRRTLVSEGISVLMAQDTAQPSKPDAVFPNNWISFHDDGTLVLYPMLAPNRRTERRETLIQQVCVAFDFQPRRRLDLTGNEISGRFLEGTGSLVLDHRLRVAYACRSPRTDESLAREWAQQMNFEAVIFDATDAAGRPYYHTNVMMWIGSRCAVVCTAAIAAADRERVCAKLEAGGREVFEIDHAAVDAFAGNMLELATWDEAMGDSSVLVMSSTAHAALAGPKLQRLSGCVDAILTVPVPTIEQVGGGSVRCMLAEVPEIRG